MLGWSLLLGTLLGIPVRVHWTFLLLIAWFAAAPVLTGGPAAAGAGIRTALFVLAVFGCVLLHELGHAIAARRYGIGTRDITLLPIGGVARLERMPEKPSQELVVALAGPAVNVLIAGILIPLLLFVEGREAFAVAPTTGEEAAALHRTRFLASLATVNVLLVLFNLIPALPMDGGRVLRAFLAMMMERGRATAVAATIGQTVAVGFALFGVFTGQLLLVLIALFVFFGASAEAQSETVRAALEGLKVRAAMLTRFRTLRASQPLRHAAAELLAGSQQDFPVLSDDAAGDDDAAALVGVLTRHDLVRAVAAGTLDAPISSAMRHGCPLAAPEDDLRATLEAMRSGATLESHPVIAVVASNADGPRIVGLVTGDNVTELVMLRNAALKR
jgi:stage IV sporulation protein FB